MRLLLDECVDARLAEVLRALGHDMALVHNTSPSVADRDVLVLALAQVWVLITSDLDFGELLVRRRLRNEGVVQPHLEGVAPDQAAARINDALAAGGAGLPGHLNTMARLREITSVA